MSFGTIIAFGYALGGLGSWAMGHPKPFAIAAGLIGGCFCAWLALRIWRVYLAGIEKEDEELRRAGEEREQRGGEKEESD